MRYIQPSGCESNISYFGNQNSMECRGMMHHSSNDQHQELEKDLASAITAVQGATWAWL